MIKTPKHLAYTLQVKISEIYSIIENIDNFYTEHQITKDKDGNGKKKVRILNPSHRRLKIIQGRILNNILLQLDLPDYAYGSVKGRDNVSNANAHKGKRYLFTTDLRKFFPSINHNRVFQMFLTYDFSPEISRILTQLTTYKGRLPQGTPTSPYLANLVFVKTGKALGKFALDHKITFTSFIDDLTFSSPIDFKDKTQELLDVITNDGFRISHNKTRYSSNSIITGIHPMNNYLKLPDKFIQKLKNTDSLSEDQIRGLYLYKKKVTSYNT